MQDQKYIITPEPDGFCTRHIPLNTDNRKTLVSGNDIKTNDKNDLGDTRAY